VRLANALFADDLACLMYLASDAVTLAPGFIGDCDGHASYQ